MLNERKKKILQIIIEDYISTAEPVGSRTIARKHDLGLSPATIRNEMSDLELLGYLEQPHTSAGRVPSAQAYRFYVDSMIEPDTLDDNDRTLINTLYRERQRSIDDIFLSTAKILSQMTHNVSMVLANQHSISRFCYLKFLPLDTNHAILCIVTDDGNVNNCVVEIPAGMSAKELEYMAGRITRMLEGKAVTDIDKALLDEVQAAVKDDRLLLSSLLHVLRRMTRPEIFQTDGAPTHLHTDTIRSLAKRHPLGTVLFLCAFGFSRRDASAAGAALSDAALRTALFAGALLGTLLGASAGYLAGTALKPSPAQPDLFEAAGLVCLAGLTAFTVRLLWVRLSHRWSEHENPIGRR